jgi:hypothetical protein
VKNFHIPTLKKNVSASIVRDVNDIHCVTCKVPHRFSVSEPVCVILTDQNFPPALPTCSDACCCVVLWLKDCFLSELPGLLKEYFGNRQKFLPEGSVLMFGSLSHLAKRGLENYAEECVKMQKVFSNMLPVTCSITHLVFVPLGGVDSEGLIRDLYDLDCWLRTGTGTNIPSLPDARIKFWETLCGSNKGTDRHSGRTMFMPECLTSSTKIRTVSERPPAELPEKIKPLTEAEEKTLIVTMCREINENYALNIDENPDLTRCSDSGTGKNNGFSGRVFAIGGSHLSRLAGGLVSQNCEVINLTKPGWKADPESITECKNKLRSYNLTDEDTVLLDLLSNSVYCGTDELGIPADPINTDGKWHIAGELTIRPKTVLKSILNQSSELFGNTAPRIISMVPVPRYISAKCCNTKDHIKKLHGSGLYRGY